MRFMSSLMKVFAWISIVLGVLGMVSTVLGALTNAVTVNVFQPQAAALAALSGRVKDAFDPRHILNPKSKDARHCRAAHPVGPKPGLV